MCPRMVSKLIDKIGPSRHTTHLCSPFVPSTGSTRYRISEKMSLKKKEQERQHDYPLSNHLRCDTM